MLELVPGWTMEMERGPDWLIVRLHRPTDVVTEEIDLAATLWSLLRQHFTCRLVLELDEVPNLDDALIDQILQLRDHIEEHHGLLRLCGLSDAHQKALQSRLAGRLPHYRDRTEAVLGCSLLKPR